MQREARDLHIANENRTSTVSQLHSSSVPLQSRSTVHTHRRAQDLDWKGGLKTLIGRLQRDKNNLRIATENIKSMASHR